MTSPQASSTSPDGSDPSKISITREFMAHGRFNMVLIGVLGLASVAGTLAFPYLVGKLIEAIQAGSPLLLPSLWMVVAGLGGAVAGAIATFLVGRTGERIIGRLRGRVMAHSLGMRLKDIKEEGVGNLSARLNADAFQVKAAIDIGPLQLPTSALILLGTLAIMGLLDWVLLLITLACFAAAFVVIGFLMISLRKKYKELQDQIGSLSDNFVNQMQAVAAIKAYRAESIILRRLTRRADELADLGVSASRIESMLVPAVTLGQQIALVGVLVGGGTRVIGGDLDLPTYIAFLLYLLQLVGPVVMAVSGLTTIQGGMIARARFESVFAMPTEKAFEPDPDAASANATDEGELQADVPSAVTFDGVSFGYGGPSVLQDVTFDVPRRGLTALVGLSGSGKTTILDLIERFAVDQSGAITFFGHQIEHLSLSEVRRNIAYVDQSFTLVQGTVRENLNLGRPREVQEHRLGEVLRMLGLEECIEALPEGLDTEIGGSTDLSGGQKQRLALARAVLSDAPLVLLDEPSSQLDGFNEEKLRLCVREMSRDRAVLMVAHRLSTVQNASKIVVLDGGRIASEGTHEELLLNSQAYSLLASEQTLNKRTETDEGQLVPQ